MSTGAVAVGGLRGRGLLTGLDLTPAEFRQLLDLAAALKAEKAGGRERPRLAGRNIALIHQQVSTRTRCAFEVAAHDQGAHTTYLGPDESPMGTTESLADTARVLGRMFDGIEFRGGAQSDAEVLGRHAGVPVWNGLTDLWHPTQMLADMLTVREQSVAPLTEVAIAFLGDGRNHTARSLLATGALLGMDIRVAAPRVLWPDPRLRAVVDELATRSAARLTVTTDPRTAVRGADFVYTDVWVTAGEPVQEWDRRADLLRPYQVDRALLEATGNRSVRFLHCLPALHDRATALGERLFERTGYDGLEVTGEVFESSASVVFDQAENRLHTAKALMVATVGR